TATVTGTSSQSVVWSVMCTSSAASITSGGVLTAPATAQSCTVTATGAGATMGSATVQVVVPTDLTISGTVAYAGTPGSHSVFLSLLEVGNNETVGGTHITAPGSFTIRGVQPNHNYHLVAWDDVSGQIAPNYALDPNADVTLPSNLSSNVTGLT